MTTYEEWRVTGTPGRWPIESTYRTESEARGYITNATCVGGWKDGPRLHKRTVTVTDWEAIQP